MVKERNLLIQGRWLPDNFECVMVNLYAPCEAEDKRQLRNELTVTKMGTSTNWCCTDFNTTRNSEEKKGCLTKSVGTEDFEEFINEGDLWNYPCWGRNLHGTVRDKKK